MSQKSNIPFKVSKTRNPRDLSFKVIKQKNFSLSEKKEILKIELQRIKYKADFIYRHKYKKGKHEKNVIN